VGVRQGTAVSNLFTVAKVVPLLMVILAGAAAMFVGPAAPAPVVATTHSSWLKAMVLLIFAYGGFETGMVPMGEAKNPKRDAGFALFASLIACTAIYALVQWVVVGVLGTGATSDRPLAEVARLTMGSLGASVVAVGALVAIYGYLSAKLLGMPRITFALAEQGDLPAIFAAVGRRHTPWFSILVYGAAVWGLAAVGSFAWNVTLSVMARLFYYGVVCAALIVLRRKQPGGAELRLPGGPVLAVVGILICLVLATQVDLSKSLIVLATVAAAVLNWAWVRRGQRSEA
jgi:basic amino acid/polyamine antiporter, APA family